MYMWNLQRKSPEYPISGDVMNHSEWDDHSCERQICESQVEDVAIVVFISPCNSMT